MLVMVAGCCLVLLQGKTIRYRDGVFPPTGSLLAWLDFNNIVRVMNDMCKQVCRGREEGDVSEYA